MLIDFDSHARIVSCWGFFRANGTAYLVMAFKNGQSLGSACATRSGRSAVQEWVRGGFRYGDADS